MRYWRAKLGKLRNAKCETTVCVNEHQREDNERSNRRNGLTEVTTDTTYATDRN